MIFDKKSIFDDRFATLYSMRIFSPVQHLLEWCRQWCAWWRVPPGMSVTFTSTA